jgi:uroporphyrinogen decarboxylase
MNGFERITAALKGAFPDRTPVMLHNFMLAAREAGVTMREYRESPEIIARCFIQAVEEYDYDGILVDVDTATLAGAVGVPVDFPEDAPARCERGLLTGLGQVDDLPPVDVACYQGVQVWLEAVRILRKYFRDEVFIRGNCDQAPFSLASLMRSLPEWLMDLMDAANHRLAWRLLDYCAEASRQFLVLMAAAGAHMLSNGDSPAGPDLSSPALYRKFALPYEKQMVKCAHELGLPYMLHICGKTNLILRDMLSTGADALELDQKTDPRLAHEILKDRATFVGNIDPNAVLALGTPALVEEKTRELVEIFSDTPRFILNAGCAIPATTPPENLRAMIRAARA